jgi:peptide/nickel transport system permease protein
LNSKGKFLTKLGLSLISFVFFIAIFAPILTGNSPTNMNLKERFQSPSLNHLMGTDQNGVDVFAQIVFGARISLTVAIAVVIISLLIGLIVGSLAGYLGGWIDILIMRFIDMIFAFPGFLLILTVAAILQSSSVGQIIFVLCLTGWASYARLIRGEILHLKHKDFVLSADAMGVSPLRKIVFYIWPNLIGPVMIQASFGMSVIIITESSLSFLGIGVPPSTPTWGSLLSSGRNYLLEAPYMSLFPGLALMIVVLGFNLLGDGLRDLLDPKN